jgi:two-component sensor histidine kinase
VRWIGTCTDIHDAKLVAEANELLSHELSHRIKNIFSVVSSLIALTAREFPEAKAFATRFRGRVASLGRAHEFVRLHSKSSRPAVERTTLQGLLASLFERSPAFEIGRISVSGDDPIVDDRGATPLALLFHELVTNAIKYGALSNEVGKVVITIQRHDANIVVEWTELEGPAIKAEPSHAGFGSKLAVMSVERQLGGKFSREWPASGLRAKSTVAEHRLARRA